MARPERSRAVSPPECIAERIVEQFVVGLVPQILEEIVELVNLTTSATAVCRVFVDVFSTDYEGTRIAAKMFPSRVGAKCFRCTEVLFHVLPDGYFITVTQNVSVSRKCYSSQI